MLESINLGIDTRPISRMLTTFTHIAQPRITKESRSPRTTLIAVSKVAPQEQPSQPIQTRKHETAKPGSGISAM